MGTGFFPGVKSRRGVTLTRHPFLVPWSWKGRVIPLLPLWAVQPVQSLSACTRVTFTFTFKVPDAVRGELNRLYILTTDLKYHITSYQIISFIFFPLIHTELQNPYGHGNSHICGNQEVKPTQKCTTITWSSAVLGFSRTQII